MTNSRNLIGNGNRCFITFEAGPTHGGFEGAKRLIRHASDAGADAIKFQIIDPDRLVADKNQLFEFDVLLDKVSYKTKIMKIPLYQLLKERSLLREQWIELKTYSDEQGLAFFATAGFEDEVEMLAEINCQSIKIASADLNHIPLLRVAATSGMLVQIDTGNASLGEVEKAVDTLYQAGLNNKNLVIHQCPSGYPARLESINLNMIPTLKTMFDCPIAYSDHSPGWEMDIAALALGVDLLEKTITEDRCTPSVEHMMSIEPHEMKNFIQSIRDVEIALGSSRRSMSDEQIYKRNMVRRSLYITEQAKAGQKLKNCKWEYRRPGNGLGPDQHDKLMEAVLKEDVSPQTKIKIDQLGLTV